MLLKSWFHPPAQKVKQDFLRGIACRARRNIPLSQLAVSVLREAVSKLTRRASERSNSPVACTPSLARFEIAHLSFPPPTGNVARAHVFADWNLDFSELEEITNPSLLENLAERRRHS